MNAQEITPKPQSIIRTLLPFILLMALAGVVSIVVFRHFGTTHDQLEQWLVLLSVVWIMFSALRTAVVNAKCSFNSDNPVKWPLLQTLRYWLAPGIVGLAMMVVCVGCLLSNPESVMPDMGTLQALLLFWLMWTAIGQLVGRMNQGKPQYAVIAVIAIGVALWLSVALARLWSSEASTFILVPDMVSMLTSKNELLIPDAGQMQIQNVVMLSISPLAFLWFSYRSFAARARAVISPVSGLVLTAVFAGLLTAINMLFYHGHLNEYPCGGHWGEELRRQFISTQIPLLFAGLMYGVSVTSTREMWQNSVHSGSVRLRYLLVWGVLHGAIWLMLLLPAVLSSKGCGLVTQMVLLMPLSVMLIITAVSLLCQSLRLSCGANPWSVFAVASIVLCLPVIPAGDSARWPLRNLLDVILTASQRSGSGVWICLAVLLLLALASGGYLILVLRKLRPAS